MQSHIGCICLTFLHCAIHVSPQMACLRGCKVTLVTFVWLFPTVHFHVFPQSKVTLVAFVQLFSSVCFHVLPVHMWLWWGIFPGITPPDVKSKCVNWWLEARENILERVFDPRPVVTPNPTQPSLFASFVLILFCIGSLLTVVFCCARICTEFTQDITLKSLSLSLWSCLQQCY